MGTPTQRTTKSRTNLRRSQHALKRKQAASCEKCGATRHPHKACRKCGAYRGRQVIK